MKFQFSIALILLTIVFLSCDNHFNAEKNFRLNDSQFVKFIYRENGSLFSEQKFIILPNNDTLPNGYQKLYYKDGALGVISFYNHGKIDGIKSAYYKDGTLKGSINNYKGIPLGTSIFYFPDGKIETIHLLNSKGAIFTLKYDQNRNIIKKWGIPILIHMDSSTISITDTLRIINEVVNNAQFKSILDITFTSLTTGNVYRQHITDFSELDGMKFYLFKGYFSEPAKWVYQTSIKLYDTHNNLIISDIALDTINVVSAIN